MAEARKCILVCANCHRGIHSGFVDIPKDWQSFYNEEIANELLQSLEKKKYYCPDCGKEISKNATRCVHCAHKKQMITEHPSREVLKNLIRTQTFESIGRMYTVNGNAVRKWCDKEGLPRTKKEIKKYSDEEWAEI